MYSGRIVERGSTEEIFHSPQHPYTWGLLSSIPRLDNPRDEELVPISGRPPSLINRPSGCHFHPRCPYVREAHKRVDPKLAPVDGTDHRVACLLESSVRSRIWDGILTGRDADSLVRMAAASAEPDYSDIAIPVDQESEGTDLSPGEEGIVESEAPGVRHGAAPPDSVDEVNRRFQQDRNPPGSGDVGGPGGP